MNELVTLRGGCHCKYVRFQVRAQLNPQVIECNCSICSMTGFVHLIVPSEHFKLLTGNDFIQTYTFNTGTAKHHFCRHCGIKSFYVPRSHPEGYSINVRCLDDPKLLGDYTIRTFDGAHWEKSIESFRAETDSR